MAPHLVHIHLRSRGAETALSPEGVAALAALADRPGVVHAVVHSSVLPHPVVGLYLREPGVLRAEESARRLWRQLAAAEPSLRGWELVRAEVPLLVLDDLRPEDC
ncbi:hypothetical protein ACFCWB_16665 [Streptomyces bacillaris]|uniref:hypothetical protein n=1 Tax=Streptomyces bacillaris TaxID=68179 RepID=UPI0035DE4507